MPPSPGTAGVEVSLRVSTSADFAAVLGLLRQLWPDLELDPVMLEAVFRECLETPTYFALCAVAAGRVVGFCDLTTRLSLWQSGKLAYLEDLVVDESFRGRGVGEALLRRAAEIATENGCRHIALDSFFHRENAHRFYENRGMKRLGFIFGRDL